MFDVLDGLEAVLISCESDGVNETVSSDVLVTAVHFDRLVVLADLLQSSLLLTRCAVARFKSVERKFL